MLLPPALVLLLLLLLLPLLMAAMSAAGVVTRRDQEEFDCWSERTKNRFSSRTGNSDWCCRRLLGLDRQNAYWPRTKPWTPLRASYLSRIANRRRRRSCRRPVKRLERSDGSTRSASAADRAELFRLSRRTTSARITDAIVNKQTAKQTRTYDVGVVILCTHTHTRAQTHARTLTSKSTHTRAHARTQTQAHTHTHTSANGHSPTHTDAQTHGTTRC